MTEGEILERLRRRIRWPRNSELIAGIGDDCAIYRPRASREDLVLTTDMLIEGVHFETSTHRASDIGHKALARGLSDIAAMGAQPRFCLLSLALAPHTDGKWIERFYNGLLALSERHRAVLAGGDLSHSDRITCDIVVVGGVPRGKALLRSGALAGDAIYVSGGLGGSALGLATGRGAAKRRHLRPEPRVELGQFLRSRLRATAAMDLSDGLSLDLARMCEASGTSANIEFLPRFPGATPVQALHGGEDYELLFTVSPKTRVPSEHAGVPLTSIGTMQGGSVGRVFLNSRPLAALGYDHFRQ